MAIVGLYWGLYSLDIARESIDSTALFQLGPIVCIHFPSTLQLLDRYKKDRQKFQYVRPLRRPNIPSSIESYNYPKKITSAAEGKNIESLLGVKKAKTWKICEG